jgi:hypothetical protein
MTIDQPFAELNRAATDRLRTLATHLTDSQLQRRVG